MFDYFNNFYFFYTNDIIKKLSTQKRWTISDNKKMPIDMTDLLESRGQYIHGAIINENHNPFLDLPTLMQYMPNAANNAFYLDAKKDNIIVLDIEPKCPKDIAEELLKLPALYGEYSMSGKGYHLILPLPNTYEDVYSMKTAIKEEHGYYEFLCNHYITFTRNILPAGLVPDMGTKTYDDFIQIWDNIAKNIDTSPKPINTTVLEDEEKTEWTDYIQKVLQNENNTYSKTLEDFENDYSVYEFGYTGYIYRELFKLLVALKVCYTKEQMVWEIYRATSELIPYRPKHDEYRDGMPWLLYNSVQIVNRNYDENELKNAINGVDDASDMSNDDTSNDDISNDDISNDDISNDDTSNVNKDIHFDYGDYEEDSSNYSNDDYMYDDE